MRLRKRQVDTLADAVRAGDRRALARAITLVESTRTDHRSDAEALLDRLLPQHPSSIRIGISGAPGVGKSSFIEAFGLYLTGRGHKVAVLAVDPSSSRGGGSILGDKTRMPDLSREPHAFIRPSPSGGSLGGVARRTREAMLLAEAAGFDVVIVETVGVGQSETAVADMVDMFLLLLAPGAGDELQGIKRGIMELADLVVVNKADGELLNAARHAATDYKRALALLRPLTPHWRPKVRLVSALRQEGMAAVWDAVTRFREALEKAGGLEARRRAQAGRWFWAEVDDRLREALRDDPAVAALVPALETEVAAGGIAPTAAARRLLDAFLGSRDRPAKA